MSVAETFYRSFRWNEIESLEIMFQLASRFALSDLNNLTKLFTSFFDNFKTVFNENKSEN